MKQFLFLILRFTGIPFLLREIFQRRKVTILLFHDLSKKEAALIFTVLKEKYNIISLGKLMDVIKNNTWESLPEKSAVITFDDGLKSNYDILPEIKKYSIPVTIFLCTGIVNTNRHFWFHKKHPEISKNKLKQKPNKERLELLKDVGFSQEKNYDKAEAISSLQVREMMPYVDFQAHTMFHPILPMCTNEEAREEIFKSKKYLEDNFGIKVNAFSYPNGNYSDREIELCKEAGFTGAITVDFGYNSKKTNPYCLKRLPVDGTEDINELLVKASGLSEILGIITGHKPRKKYSHNPYNS